MNFLSEPILTLAEAAQRLPGRPHTATLHRWSSSGLRGIRLRTMKLGGRRVVALADLESFIERVTAASDKYHPPAPRSSARRKREIENAEAALIEAGLIDNQRTAKNNSGGD